MPNGESIGGLVIDLQSQLLPKGQLIFSLSFALLIPGSEVIGGWRVATVAAGCANVDVVHANADVKDVQGKPVGFALI